MIYFTDNGLKNTLCAVAKDVILVADTAASCFAEDSRIYTPFRLSGSFMKSAFSIVAGGRPSGFAKREMLNTLSELLTELAGAEVSMIIKMTIHKVLSYINIRID